MWSMWNAPSDRDYYDQFSEPEPEEICYCGARWDQECEEDCPNNRPDSEPQIILDKLGYPR